jgi:hypothetical protein
VAGAFDALDGVLKGGEGAEGGERPAAALYREAGEGLEVEGKPDVRGRPGSERREGEGKVGWRRCWWAGREGGPRGEKERREEARGAAQAAGP